MTDRLAMTREFEKLLNAEAAKRDERREEIDGQPEWVFKERWAMLQRVNSIRAARGKSHVEEERFVRMERMCEGHSDYGHKLSLYCMEFVLDKD